MSKGYVYILSNPSMPGILKIGRTTRDPEGRAAELYQTGVPTPFKVEHSVFSPDCAELECAVHSEFGEIRVSAGREFFCVSLDVAVQSLNNAHLEITGAWLDEFMPGHTPAEPDMMVPDHAVMMLADEMGAHPFEVVSAMGMVTAEELDPALNRWRAKVANMAARRAAAKEATH